jgi:hypothetical protein
MENRERGVAPTLTAVALRSPRREQARAVYPDERATLNRAGVPVRWESYGRGDLTILFLPTWSIVHSRCWKQQILE